MLGANHSLYVFGVGFQLYSQLKKSLYDSIDVRLANSKARIKPTAPLSVFDKENSIELLLDLVHYIYIQSNPNPVLLSHASLWVNSLLHIHRYYKLKEKRRKAIFKIKKRKKKEKK